MVLPGGLDLIPWSISSSERSFPGRIPENPPYLENEK
jgi:hypothetical protein